ncbi:hypothetical protein CPAR01_14727 [Colletotrichum paranaense]|uniref:Uncharacterized protein n=6 Tax=Colletotrichum acutatum species complex TaxID=2707335 RepID=A0A9Q0AYW2_9PEZI|nr:uncharacterized protein CCOS01_07816 [Colletotrichum costaricense]XP_060342440.1 uncharacterized protein CPAR01_14727 [Colletotrichum paranaense]XP_060384627.1 uncharacterized protein CTAM01_04643 [Colletotrichum tamarilloi]KAI3539798.1 hypothetical protein CABS02_11254 [Colletotrichum abscissum]KAI3551571.1 hypothetical protein CSPX01_00913 [Colletotrichum filicis]KAK0378895.1 hypothetical protein CLIM01_03732 [Colletotrichum limetticola]KAK1451642.1 hypothetical protein CMEL01_06216 [Col
MLPFHHATRLLLPPSLVRISARGSFWTTWPAPAVPSTYLGVTLTAKWVALPPMLDATLS